MRVRSLPFLILALAGILARQLSAQESDLVLPARGTRNEFGAIAGTDLPGKGYLGTGARFLAQDGTLALSPTGVAVFIQGNAIFPGNMPRAADNMFALAQKDFIAVYSAPGLMPARDAESPVPAGMFLAFPDLEQAAYLLRIRDSRSSLWVNPALFVKDFYDQRAPRIESLILSGDSGRVLMPESRKITSRILQGEYSIVVQATDPWSRNEESSGIFRWKVLLDGQVLSDRKLDAARITSEGLDFMELGAPSGRLVSGTEGLLLGKTFLAKGSHVLRITVYDFSGNFSEVEWKFIVL
jgi:hypothetical protein